MSKTPPMTTSQIQKFLGDRGYLVLQEAPPFLMMRKEFSDIDVEMSYEPTTEELIGSAWVGDEELGVKRAHGVTLKKLEHVLHAMETIR